ncbi:MAG: recombinase family protein [Clostridiales bacterium]|nr:recombinase family protein [Clostridiales bacterium]MCF8022635.1 recombinase family protein [Clostridiales bacterium]
MSVAAIYCRQSIVKEDSCSIDMQEHRCQALAQSMGWEFTTYKDAGESGKDLDRPQFQQMYADIKSGLVHTVIVYKLDRISRNLRDFFNLIEEFKELEVGFRSINENFDTTTTIGRAVLGVLAVFAQFERETTAERVRDNMCNRARNGTWNGGVVPLGFKLVKKDIDGEQVSILEQNEKYINIVREIFNKYSMPSVPAARITKDFNDAGVKTPKGGYFNDSLIKRTITNPIYCAADKEAYDYFLDLGAEISSPKEDFDGSRGIMIYNRRKPSGKKTSKERDVSKWIVAVGYHPPVISGEIFTACQQKMKHRKWQPPRNNTGQRGLLATLIKCGKCGLSMTTNYSYKKNKHGTTYYTYYKCTGKRRHTCDMKDIRTETIDNLVIEALNKIVDDSEFRDKQIESAQKEIKDSTKNLKSELDRLKELSKEHEQEENNLINALGKGTIKINLIEKRLNELENEKESTQNKILELEKELQEKGMQEINIEMLVSNLKKFKDCFEELTFDEKRNLLQSLIYKVIAYEDSVSVILYDGCVSRTNGQGFIAPANIIRAG